MVFDLTATIIIGIYKLLFLKPNKLFYQKLTDGMLDYGDILIKFLFELLDLKIGDIELMDGDKRLEGLSRAERELVEDTFRVLSISFSYIDGSESIDEYLTSRDAPPTYAYVIYMNLGDLYLDNVIVTDSASREAVER